MLSLDSPPPPRLILRVLCVDNVGTMNSSPDFFLKFGGKRKNIIFSQLLALVLQRESLFFAGCAATEIEAYNLGHRLSLKKYSDVINKTLPAVEYSILIL